MTTQVGKVSIEYLGKPTGIIYEFTTYLASNADRLGNRCALGFYLQEQMEQMAIDYLEIYPALQDKLDELRDWIKALPWPETGYLALAFNW